MIIKGNGADANSDFLRAGYTEAGVPDGGENSDTITIVGETYTDNWDPALAQTEMEQFLTENNNEVDAVLSENDGMAGGVVAALEAQGSGQIPVSGQDGDIAALNRVALGTQNGRRLEGRLASWVGPPARPQLAAVREPGHHRAAGRHRAAFDSPGGNTLTRSSWSRSRSPRTTWTSCSTPTGSQRKSSARASRPARSTRAPDGPS